MSDRENPFREVENLLDQFAGFGTAAGDLPVDIVDADDELLVTADLPGRDPEEIAVQLEDDRRLAIEAGQRAAGADSEGRYVTRERSTGAVSRTVTLPAAVDEDETGASYDRGVLTIRLAKLSADTEGTDIPVS